MPVLVEAPAVVPAAGDPPKTIEKYAGRVRYGSPEPGGAETVAVCLPAFSLETVHRDG